MSIEESGDIDFGSSTTADFFGSMSLNNKNDFASQINVSTKPTTPPHFQPPQQPQPFVQQTNGTKAFNPTASPKTIVEEKSAEEEDMFPQANTEFASFIAPQVSAPTFRPLQPPTPVVVQEAPKRATPPTTVIQEDGDIFGSNPNSSNFGDFIKPVQQPIVQQQFNSPVVNQQQPQQTFVPHQPTVVQQPVKQQQPIVSQPFVAQPVSQPVFQPVQHHQEFVQQHHHLVHHEKRTSFSEELQPFPDHSQQIPSAFNQNVFMPIKNPSPKPDYDPYGQQQGMYAQQQQQPIRHSPVVQPTQQPVSMGQHPFLQPNTDSFATNGFRQPSPSVFQQQVPSHQQQPSAFGYGQQPYMQPYQQQQPYQQPFVQQQQSLANTKMMEAQLFNHGNALPRPIVAFGFGGKLITIFPKRVPKLNVLDPTPEESLPYKLPGAVQVHQLKDVLATQAHVYALQNFPGPLNANTNKQELIGYIEKEIQRAQYILTHYGMDAKASSTKQLWQLLRVLSQTSMLDIICNICSANV